LIGRFHGEAIQATLTLSCLQQTAHATGRFVVLIGRFHGEAIQATLTLSCLRAKSTPSFGTTQKGNFNIQKIQNNTKPKV